MDALKWASWAPATPAKTRSRFTTSGWIQIVRGPCAVHPGAGDRYALRIEGRPEDQPPHRGHLARERSQIKEERRA